MDGRRSRQALSQQLATDYLRTQARRSGILVITHHGSRTWHAPEDSTRLSFGPLISRLKRLAETLTSNPTGPIKVQVVGIDATAAAAEGHPQEVNTRPGNSLTADERTLPLSFREACDNTHRRARDTIRTHRLVSSAPCRA